MFPPPVFMTIISRRVPITLGAVPSLKVVTNATAMRPDSTSAAQFACQFNSSIAPPASSNTIARTSIGVPSELPNRLLNIPDIISKLNTLSSPATRNAAPKNTLRISGPSCLCCSIHFIIVYPLLGFLMLNKDSALKGFSRIG